MRVNGAWVSLLTLVLVVAVLWAAKAVLLPLALGIILAFTLTPLVRCSIAADCRVSPASR